MSLPARPPSPRNPPRPRPLKQEYPEQGPLKPLPKLKLRPERMRMTIALGILAGGGAVLAADSQETDTGSGFKDFALKVTASIPQGVSSAGPRSVIAVTGCGPGFQLDVISDKLKRIVQSRPVWDTSEFEIKLDECVRGFYREHVLPSLPHLDYRFNLIVGCQFDGITSLWSSDADVIRRMPGFDAVGTGKNYAKTAIYTRIIHPTIEQAVLLAIRGVVEAKRFDQYCGQSTTVICLRNNSSHYVPWYLIEPAEKLFKRYAGIESSAFQFAIGHFQEDEEKKHLRKMSSWYRELRRDFKSLESQIAQELGK